MICQEATTNQWLTLCQPLIGLVEPFINHPDEINLPKEFHDQIIRKFTELDAAVKQHKLSIEAWQATKYALAALIDELVLSAKWEYKNVWMAIPLQAVFFGEHLAGEGFFKKLEALRQNPIKHREVIEIYLLCLIFGFEGKYRDVGFEKREALTFQVYQQLQQIKQNENSDNKNSRTRLHDQNKTNLDKYIIGFSVLVTIIAMFMMQTHYHKAIGVMDKQVVKTMNKFLNREVQVVS